jgi:hypothetical protein
MRLAELILLIVTTFGRVYLEKKRAGVPDKLAIAAALYAVITELARRLGIGASELLSECIMCGVESGDIA